MLKIHYVHRDWECDECAEFQTQATFRSVKGQGVFGRED